MGYSRVPAALTFYSGGEAKDYELYYGVSPLLHCLAESGHKIMDYFSVEDE